MKFTVFYGSVREGRLGFRVAKHIVSLLKSKQHEVFLFDPIERSFPLLKKAYHHYPNPNDAPNWLKEVHNEIISSDGYIVVSAEYNYSIPPALSNAIDHFPPSDFWSKPCGIVTYSMGQFGGTSATTQLRNMLGIMGMVTPPFTFLIPKVHEAFSEEGEPLNDYMRANGQKLVGDVEWYAEAIKNQKKSSTICPPSY